MLCRGAMVAQLTVNQFVAGSSPADTANIKYDAMLHRCYMRARSFF